MLYCQLIPGTPDFDFVTIVSGSKGNIKVKRTYMAAIVDSDTIKGV